MSYIYHVNVDKSPLKFLVSYLNSLPLFIGCHDKAKKIAVVIIHLKKYDFKTETIVTRRVFYLILLIFVLGNHLNINCKTFKL